MSSLFDFTVTGDREVIRSFDHLTPELRDELRSEIAEISDRLFSQIEAAIPKRTGRLASELTHGLSETANEITGWVTFDAEFAKAAALEYGAHGTAKVRPHPMHLTQVFGHLLTAPIIVTTEAYTRQMNIAAVMFMRGPFQEDESGIVQQLEAAVQSATEKAQQ